MMNRRQYLLTVLRDELLNLNEPTKYWPKAEIIRLAAKEFVCEELIARLEYRTYMSPEKIFIEYKDDICNYADIACTNIGTRDILMFWEMAEEYIGELICLYY